ncbi:MAG: rhodanese-like domain-containing protein [Verrucomicrobiota bacterium]
MKAPARLQTALTEDLAGLWLLLTATVVLAFTANLLRDEPVSLTYQSKEQRLAGSVATLQEDLSLSVSQGSTPLPEALDLEAFRQFVQAGQGLILDARPAIFHQLGHVPGARSLPRDDFENAYRLLRANLDQNKSQPLVIYCSSASCEDSHLVADALRDLGFSNVTIFTGGWAAWTRAGLPEESDS